MSGVSRVLVNAAHAIDAIGTPPRKRIRRDLVRQLALLINQERIRIGLPALLLNGRLSEAAIKHSLDMINRRYFSHNSPEGLTVKDRVLSTGFSPLCFGENLAHNNISLENAHQGLMNSPGHRDNILNARFIRIGIGIVDNGPGTAFMITEVFSD